MEMDLINININQYYKEESKEEGEMITKKDKTKHINESLSNLAYAYLEQINQACSINKMRKFINCKQ